MAGSAFGSVVNMTGKLGSKINSRAGSLGEAGKKSYKGYAANKYQHDPKGRLGRFNNAWARSASGNYLPTRGGAARTAAAGLAYSNQQKQETDTLVASALHGQGYEEQGQTLIKLMAGKDEKVADAARQKAVGTGRIDLVEQSLYTPGTGTKDPTTGKIIGATINDAALKGHYELMRNSSDYGKAVAQQRADLAIDLSDFSDRQVQTTDPITGATTTTTETAVSQYRTALKKTMEKKSADDLLASNDSLYKQTYGPLVPGVDALEFIDQSVIDEIANNSNYRGRLQTSGRDFIESKKSSRSGRP